LQVKGKIPYIERHLLTDEVFVPLNGKARLVEGGTASTPRPRLRAIPLKTGTVYNVAKRTWHFTLMSDDARLLIVENRNTSRKNSEYHHFTESEKKAIRRRF
jgi:ureidoglycolate hydrolase